MTLVSLSWLVAWRLQLEAARPLEACSFCLLVGAVGQSGSMRPPGTGVAAS